MSNNPQTPDPIRKSSLPTTPPPEFVFSTVLGARPDGHAGCLLLPGDVGDVVVRRRVTYGDWEPVRPDRWADEPVADVVPAVLPAVPVPPATPATDRDRAALRDRIAEAALLAVESAMDDTLLPAARQEALAGIAAVLPPPADRAAVLHGAADDVAAMRIGAEDPNPDAHVRGYNDGLDHAEAELRRMADETQASWTPGPVAVARAAEWASQQRAATVDPAMCPRCRGDNSEAFELCAACATTPPAVVAEPGKENDDPRTVCVCGHTRGEHAVVGGPFGRGRLLCDECNGLDGGACKEFEAL